MLVALPPDGEAVVCGPLRPVEITVLGSLRSWVDRMNMVSRTPAPSPCSSASPPAELSQACFCLVSRTPSAAEAAPAARSFSRVGMNLAHFMQVAPDVQRDRGLPPRREKDPPPGVSGLVRSARESLPAGT